MVIGISMIKVMPGRERPVYCAIRSMNGVLDIYHIFGEFDFFIILQAEGFSKLNQLLEEFQKLEDVLGVRTILVGIDNCLHEHAPLKVLA
jgi:hypothetical protein